MAGVKRERLGGYSPTGTGRLCEWKEDPTEPAELSRYKFNYVKMINTILDLILNQDQMTSALIISGD